MKNILKIPYIKNILSALAIAAGGFVLLNLTFMLYALIINGILFLLPAGFAMTSNWFMPFMVTIIGLSIITLYFFIFKSKIKEIYKAIFMTVPASVVLATIGIFLYRWPVAVYSLSGLFVVGFLYYFYRTKQSWLYYFAVILVALVMLVMTLTGAEI